MAKYKMPQHFGGLLFLRPITVRRTRDNKVAHLFVDYENGAISGVPRSFCGVVAWPKNSYWPNKGHLWTDVGKDTLPLCNQCGRAFHKEHRDWNGTP